MSAIRLPTRPVRLQLSRASGFNLRAYSQNTNGLDAVVVARPGKWGNPFTVERYGRERAVHLFEEWLREKNPDLVSLRGKNLACWCKLGEACHADVLLRAANK